MPVFIALAVAGLVAGFKWGPLESIEMMAVLFVLMPYDNRRVIVRVLK
jgi:hypothetical protein